MERSKFLEKIENSIKNQKVTAILGPRQCGKTTLAQTIFEKRKEKIENYFDLESHDDLSRLENPELALSDLSGLVVIDEIQRAPGLFQTLRTLVDRKNSLCKFLILGSASRDLIQQSSESLAGRIRYIELTPFQLGEVDSMNKIWVRGGFPESYLAQSDKSSFEWRQDYVRTFLERDIPNLGIRIPSRSLRRFWMMICHYHGQILNSSEIGTALGISHSTVKRYIDILSETFMLRVLPPWYENIKKRQVKSPKIFLRDSGLLHLLLSIPDKSNLLRNPKLGASWEGFAMEEVIRHFQFEPENTYFWGIHQQSELDLLVFYNGEKIGFEIKYNDSPKITRSMVTAIEQLGLKKIYIVYPGKKNFRCSEKIEAIGLTTLLSKNL